MAEQQTRKTKAMDTKKKLREIAKKTGYRVRQGKHFQVFFGSATIKVDNAQGPRVWSWRMLHELGHAELMKRHEKNHINTFYRLYKMSLEEYTPREAFYREYLQMEWKAWEQGLKIAKREGISINEKQYWRHARKCYLTYVRNIRNNF